VDDLIFSKITGFVTSKHPWDILQTTYKGNDRVKIVKMQTLRMDFETLKMTESENVDKFMTKVMGIVNQINLTGEDILDQRIIYKFLRSLPIKFKMFVTSILESKDLSNFSTDEVIGSLLTHETILHLEDESIDNDFKTQFYFSRGRSRGRRIGHGERGRSQRNHYSGEGHTPQNRHQNFHPQRGRGRRSNEKKSIQCYYRKKYGHYESKCQKK
jgi:hypothetical protein